MIGNYTHAWTFESNIPSFSAYLETVPCNSVILQRESWPDDFSQARYFVAAKFRQAILHQHHQAFLFKPHIFNIAAHLRLHDARPEQVDYVRQAIEQVLATVKEHDPTVLVHVHIFHEDSRIPNDFDHLPNVFPHGTPPTVAFLHFAESDVLIEVFFLFTLISALCLGLQYGLAFLLVRFAFCFCSEITGCLQFFQHSGSAVQPNCFDHACQSQRVRLLLACNLRYEIHVGLSSPTLFINRVCFNFQAAACLTQSESVSTHATML
jgi:hypothetical protein